MGKNDTVLVAVRLRKETNERIEKLAARQHKSKSQLIREFIEKGESIEGYKQDEQQISEMVTVSVKKAIEPGVERLAALSAKNGWLTGASYFLLIYTLREMFDVADRPDLEKIIEHARRLGIEYLKVKDDTVDEFIRKARYQMDNIK